MHEGSVPPVENSPSGNARGGTGPMEKSMDKPPKKYTSNETVPEHDYGETSLDEGLMENPGDLSKRFGG